jgi:hypothetical protein
MYKLMFKTKSFGHKKSPGLFPRLFFLIICFLIEPLDVAEILTVRQVRVLGIHAVCNLE